MKKIPTLFVRSEEHRRIVTQVITPGCEWVSDGEGTASRKWDGTACLVEPDASDVLMIWKRYDAKARNGVIRVPQNFRPAMDRDETTGHWAGWLPVGGEPESCWHREAFSKGLDFNGAPLYAGTYELCGPKVQTNPEQLTEHILIRHGNAPLEAPRDYAELGAYLGRHVIEGIVWAHPDGRMCKVKRSDFDLPWPVR